jgi:hypothetical protein
MKNMLTCISYSLCDRNGKATVVEYWQRYPLCRIPHHKIFENIQRTLRETGSFPWVNAEHKWWQHGDDDVLVAVQQSPSTSTWTISRITGAAHTKRYREFCIKMVSIHITYKEYNTPYQEIIPTEYGFVNGSNHSYTSFMTLVQRWGSIYPGWYYQHKEFTLLGTWGSRMSFSTLIFSWCVVRSIRQ